MIWSEKENGEYNEKRVVWRDKWVNEKIDESVLR